MAQEGDKGRQVVKGYHYQALARILAHDYQGDILLGAFAPRLIDPSGYCNLLPTLGFYPYPAYGLNVWSGCRVARLEWRRAYSVNA